MGRWKAGANGGYYDSLDSGPDQIQPQMPMPSPMMSGLPDAGNARLQNELANGMWGGPRPDGMGAEVPQMQPDGLSWQTGVSREPGRLSSLFGGALGGRAPISAAFGASPFGSMFKPLGAMGSAGKKTLGGLIGGWF